RAEVLHTLAPGNPPGWTGAQVVRCRRLGGHGAPDAGHEESPRGPRRLPDRPGQRPGAQRTADGASDAAQPVRGGPTPEWGAQRPTLAQSPRPRIFWK